MYPHKFNVSISFQDFIDKYEYLQDGNRLEDQEVSISGRIYAKRSSGTKLCFYDIQSNSARLQVLANASFWVGEEDFKTFHANVKRGDIVGVVGKLLTATVRLTFGTFFYPKRPFRGL